MVAKYSKDRKKKWKLVKKFSSYRKACAYKRDNLRNGTIFRLGTIEDGYAVGIRNN